MTVIPFPRAKRTEARLFDVPEILIRTVAIIQVLGEPVSTVEIAKMMALCRPPIRPPNIVELLWSFCEPKSELGGQGLLRQVKLYGDEAWAFTPAFRVMLSEGGLIPGLRAARRVSSSQAPCS